MVEAETFDDSRAKRPFVPTVKSTYYIDIVNYDAVSQPTKQWLTK